MRVLVDGSDVHVWATFGALTIHENGTVTWRSPFDGRGRAAPSGDGDIHLPPGIDARVTLGDEVSDALALPGGRVAIAYGRPAPRVEVVNVGDGRVEHSVPLVDLGSTRLLLPTEDEDERAAVKDEESPAFSGSGNRGIRVFPSAEGFIVTGNESGHVARYSLTSQRFDCVFRTLGAPENTVFAAELGRQVYIGLKVSGRYSYALMPDEQGDCSVWPEGDVCWGMPALLAANGALLTYSDGGTHKGALVLLDAWSLAGLDHAAIPEWPSDMHAAGDRFAALSRRHVVIGRVGEGKIRDVEIFTVAELLKRGGVGAPARSPHATEDGRGTRLWLDGAVSNLWIVDGTPLVETTEGSVLALGPSGPRVVAETTKVFDTQAGTVLLGDRGRFRFVSFTSNEVVRTEIAPLGTTWFARIFGEGLLHTSPEVLFGSQTIPLYYTRFGHREGKRIADEPRGRPPPRVIDGVAWWYEYEKDDEVLREEVDEDGVRERHVRTVSVESTLWRLTPKDLALDSFDLGVAIEDFTILDGVPYVLTRPPLSARSDKVWEIHRATEEGLVRLGPVPAYAHGLQAADGAIYFLADDGVKRFDLPTGKHAVLAASSFGRLEHLRVSAGRAHWVESGMLDVRVTSVCSLELGPGAMPRIATFADGRAFAIEWSPDGRQWRVLVGGKPVPMTLEESESTTTNAGRYEETLRARSAIEWIDAVELRHGQFEVRSVPGGFRAQCRVSGGSVAMYNTAIYDALWFYFAFPQDLSSVEVSISRSTDMSS